MNKVFTSQRTSTDSCSCFSVSPDEAILSLSVLPVLLLSFPI